MDESVISIKGLEKSYGRNRILKGINMNIKKGDLYGVIGKNGAGKTTLFKTNDDAAKVPVKRYSLGMRQRLGIAGAMLGNPDIMIFDEPTNGLDPQGIHDIRTMLKNLNEKEGKTIIISSHILSELEHTAIFIGIPIFSTVLNDDFKSRTMQTAIGRGLSRHKLIFTRLLEIIIIAFEACLVFALFTLLCGLIGGVELSHISPGIITIGRQFLLMVAYGAVAMFFTYLSQNGALGLIFYILIAAGVIGMIFNALLRFLPVIKDSDFDISSYLISGMVNKISESASFGTGLLWFFVFVVVWICLPTFITMKIFEKKELEF